MCGTGGGSTSRYTIVSNDSPPRTNTRIRYKYSRGNRTRVTADPVVAQTARPAGTLGEPLSSDWVRAVVSATYRGLHDLPTAGLGCLGGASSEAALQVVAHSQRVGHDRQRRVDRAAGREDA